MKHHDELRHILSACTKPQRPKAAVIGSRANKTFGVRMREGRVAFEYAQMLVGEKAMSHAVRRGHKLQLPRMFWSSCLLQCFNRVSTDASRKSLRKALNLYISSLRMGATTICGTLAEQIPDGRRFREGRCKCPELGQLLYDWFIDSIQLY